MVAELLLFLLFLLLPPAVKCARVGLAVAPPRTGGRPSSYDTALLGPGENLPGDGSRPRLSRTSETTVSSPSPGSPMIISSCG